MKYLWIFLSLLGSTILISLLTYALLPGTLDLFIAEDNLVENLSALLFFTAFIFGLIYYFTSRHFRLQLLALSFIGLIGFLDEISFGLRIFGFQPLKIHSFNVDGAHDFFYFGYKLLTKVVNSHSILVYALIMAGIILLVFLAVRNRRRLSSISKNLFPRETILILVTVVLALLLANLIDIRLLEGNKAVILEEILEMNAALGLLLASISIRYSPKQKLIPANQ